MSDKEIDLTKEGAEDPPSGLCYEKLTGGSGQRTRALWERIFTEDAEAFLDYYYREKIPAAQIHALSDESGRIVSMVHANPYTVMLHGARREAYYIVGVATEPPYRHQGCMAFLLQKAVRQAKSEGCPFVFLLPADPAIYEPFGFRYGARGAVWERSSGWKALTKPPMQGASAGGAPRLTGYTEADAEALALYAEKELARRYDIYCVHDKAYFDRLSRELVSENGALYLLWKRTADNSAYARGGERKAQSASCVQEDERKAQGASCVQEDECKAQGASCVQTDECKAQSSVGYRICGYFCYACGREEYLQEVLVDPEAQYLFRKKQDSDRTMFLWLEEGASCGEAYFPEEV